MSGEVTVAVQSDEAIALKPIPDLKRLAALILVSPGIQEQRRSYQTLHLCEKAMYAATRIAKRRHEADPVLVAMAFGGMFGSVLGQVSEEMIVSSVGDCVAIVQMLDEIERTAIVDLEIEEKNDRAAAIQAEKEAEVAREAERVAEEIRAKARAERAAEQARQEAEAAEKAKAEAAQKEAEAANKEPTGEPQKVNGEPSGSGEPISGGVAIADTKLSSIYKKALLRSIKIMPKLF